MKRLIVIFLLLSFGLSFAFGIVTFDVPVTVKISNNYAVTITFVNDSDALSFEIRAEDLSSPDTPVTKISNGVSKSFSSHSKKLAIRLSFYLGGSLYYYGATTYMNWTAGTYNINLEGKTNSLEPTEALVYFSPSSNEVINIGKEYATPKMNSGSTHLEANYLGRIGSVNTAHQIQFTLTSSGRFESISEPTLYRDYWIALCPRYLTGSYTTNGNPFYYDVANSSTISTTNLVPNSRDSISHTICVTTPVTYDENSTPIPIGPSTQTAYVTNQWYNIMLCMEGLDSETLKHLAIKDDYQTTINVTWECTEDNCTANHSGSYTITLRGYYSTNDPGSYLDTVNFVVSPSAESMGIDLLNMVSTASPVKIADFRVNSTARTINESGQTPSSMEIESGNCTAYPWNDHVYVFLSASSNPAESSATGFQFVNTVTRKAIPFTIQARSLTGVVNNDLTYDGTTVWTGTSGATDPSTYCLDLGDMNITRDNKGNTYGSIDFTESIYLLLPQESITMIQNYMSNTNGAGASDYPGRYEATVYYHIIYSD